jgi:hypothetical protein
MAYNYLISFYDENVAKVSLSSQLRINVSFPTDLLPSIEKLAMERGFATVQDYIRWLVMSDYNGLLLEEEGFSKALVDALDMEAGKDFPRQSLEAKKTKKKKQMMDSGNIKFKPIEED